MKTVNIQRRVTERIAALLLSVSAISLMAAGCGSKAGPNPPPPGGGSQSLAIFMKDAPSDSALSLQVTVSSVTAVNQSGQSVTLTNTPRDYELTHLSLAPTLASLQNIASGPYTGITLNLTNPQMQILDTNGNLTTLDSTTTQSISLAQASVTVPISFTLANASNGGIVLDFDLSKSLIVNNQANFVLTPTLTAAVATTTDPTPQLSSCVGTVAVLAKDGTGFDLQLEESGVIVHITADSNTFFDSSVGKLTNITQGEILEVTASLKTDGTYQAKAINSGGSSLASRQQGLFIGTYNNNSGQTVVSVAKQH